MSMPTTTSRTPRQIRRGAQPLPGGGATRRGGAGAGAGAWTTPKRVIWTGAFAAVAIVGAIYGAGLKTQQEYREEKKQILETPVEDRIRTLEAHRAQLVGQKRPLEKKLEELRLRVKKQEEKEEEEAAKMTDGKS